MKIVIVSPVYEMSLNWARMHGLARSDWMHAGSARKLLGIDYCFVVFRPGWERRRDAREIYDTILFASIYDDAVVPWSGRWPKRP